MTEECTLEFSPGGQARLGGELTFASSTCLYHSMEVHLNEGYVLERIDLSAITTADSAGLALLLEWQATTRLSGNSLTMTGAPDGLMQLAQLCDAVELLNLSGRNPD